MKCPKCGTENKQGTKFCGNCGFSLAKIEKAKENKPTAVETRKPGTTAAGGVPIWMWIVLAVCLLILIGGGLVIFKAGSQNAQSRMASSEQSNTLNPDPSCNKIGTVTDISIPDGTQIKASQIFTKVWELTNAGSCIWDANYEIVFASDTFMGAYSPLKLGRVVQPGESMKIRIKMKAPSQSGEVTGYWLLQSSTGVRFGFGEKASNPFWIKITVIQ